jgi:hypothetical protein
MERPLHLGKAQRGTIPLRRLTFARLIFMLAGAHNRPNCLRGIRCTFTALLRSPISYSPS